MSKVKRPTMVFRASEGRIEIADLDEKWVPGRRFLDLSESEQYMDYLEAELREAVRLLKRVTTELNRFHLNNKAWIGNPFECPICRMIESADTIIKRHKENT